MRYLVGLAAGALVCRLACAADTVSEADARLAMQIASGLAASSSADDLRADVASSPDEGPGRRITILDAVQLLRGARGQAPEGVDGSGLLQLRDEVRLHGETERNYTLARAYRFTGRLVDASGNPVSGAIWLEDDHGEQKAFSQFYSGAGFSVTVGAETLHPRVSAEFPLADGRDFMHVNAPLAPSADVALTGDTQRDFVRPERPPTGFVTGAVKAGELAVQDVTASVKVGGEVQASTRGTVKDGRYLLECAAGTAGLTFQAWTGDQRDTTVEYRLEEPFKVTAGQTVTRDVSLPALVTLTGRIRGGPDWPPLQVTLDNQDYSGAWLRSCVRNPARDGFRMPIEPGAYAAEVVFEQTVGAVYRQYGYPMVVVVPDGGGQATLSVPEETPERTISGRVTDAAGRAIAGARVSLFRWREKDARFAYARVDTDANGRYTVSVPEASYTVYVDPPIQ